MHIRKVKGLARDGGSLPPFDKIEKPSPINGLVFDARRIAASEIREKQDYEGLRVKLPAFLGNARIPLQIDIA